MPDEKALKILVVCLGNICRSPAGEAALKEAASHVGEPPDPQIRAAGRRAGLEIDGVGRQITSAADLEPYDVILAMDRSNLHALRRIAPELEDRMYLYRSFDPDADSDEMPDPWGMDDAAFDDTIRWARSAAEGIVEAIRSGRIP